MDTPAGPAVRRRPTLVDVAKAAGVSRAAASRALSSSGYSSDELRQRVSAAADRLGYQVNTLARNMRTGRSGTIGFVGADISNALFGRIIRGVSDVAQRNDYQLMVMNSDQDPVAERRAVESLVGRQIDGIVVAPATSDYSHLEAAMSAGVPVAIVDRVVDTTALTTDAVSIDHRDAAYRATEFLVENGHTALGLVSVLYPGDGPLRDARARADPLRRESYSPQGDRVLGHWQALRDLKITNVPGYAVLTPISDEDELVRRVEQLVRLPDRPSAVLAADQPSMLALFRVAKRNGIVIGRDLSMIGIGDWPWTELVDPTITVVDNPVYDIGVRVAEHLIERMAGAPATPGSPRLTIMDAPLIVRDSVRNISRPHRSKSGHP